MSFFLVVLLQMLWSYRQQDFFHKEILKQQQLLQTQMEEQQVQHRQMLAPNKKGAQLEIADEKLEGRSWFLEDGMHGYLPSYITENEAWVAAVRDTVGNVKTPEGRVNLKPDCRMHRENNQFGGVWLDCDDATSKISELLTKKLITDEDVTMLNDFRHKGYMVIPNAAPADAIDRLNTQMEAAWQKDKSSFYKLFIAGKKLPMSSSARKEWLHHKGSRILDTYMGLADAADLSMTAKAKRYLQLIYTDEPMAFQSLYFEFGSSQPIHQDPAYVVIDEKPKTLTATWIALEDVHEDAGPLMYYEGSNKLPDFIWPGGRPFFEGSGGYPGMEKLHLSFLDYLTAKSEHMGLKKSKFLAKKGDVLIWHSMLAHGGIDVVRPELTRKSLVTHYCPMSAAPNYFNDQNYRKRWKFKSGYFASVNFKHPMHSHEL